MLVFVTGGTGFIGSHIILELLNQGHRVKAASRGPKVAILQSLYSKYISSGHFTVVQVDDISTSDFTRDLQGCDALIHTATSMPGSSTAKGVLDAAIEGTLNAVRQAEKAGVKKIIFTSTMFALISNPNAKGTFTDQDWAVISKEEAYANTTDTRAAYRHSKPIAEKSLWEFADAHPHLDVVTFLPPFIYGPFAPTFSCPEPNFVALSTNILIYRLTTPNGIWPISPRFADVRDVAKAHVYALNSPPASQPGIGRKRLLIGHKEEFSYDRFLALIKEKRPALASRLTQIPQPEIPPSGLVYPFDMDRLEKVLPGLKREEFKSFEDTFLDTVDSLIKFENEWKDKGYEVNVPAVPTDGL